jgi:hypothetical protein
MSNQASHIDRPRFRWWPFYLIPGLLLPIVVWALVVLSRVPLSGVAPDTASLPSNVSLPPVYDSCPMRNVRWHFTDSFTGVFVVVGETDLDAIKSWVETLKTEGYDVTFGPVDSSTNVEVFVDHAKDSMPRYTGTINGKQFTEFVVSDDRLVIVSRK